MALLILATIIIIGPFIIERFRLPGMLGLVLGGVILGPYGINFLTEGSLDAIGGIGLLFLMFLAGAELDLNLFQRYRSAAVSFGLLTFFAPFILNVFASLQLELPLTSAILMGSVWSSHTLVAYPAVRQAGLASNKAVATTVGATVITDTLALLVLAVISAIGVSEESSSNTLITIIRLVVGLGILIGYCMYVLPRLGRWFFAGLGQERILIIPAFLVSVGMLINPAVLFDSQTILFAMVLLVALSVGKFLAAWIAGRRYKFSNGEIGLMFSLTIAQAAATLASTLVGFKIGLFGEQVVNAVLLVVLISLILTSIGVCQSSKSIQPERLVIKPIGYNVIVPVRPSSTLEQLMRIASDVAYIDAGVVTPVAIIPEHIADNVHSEGEEWLHKAEEFALAAAADVEGILRIDSDIHQGVLRESTERQGSIILVEWIKNPSAQEIMFGNMIDHIGSRSPVPAAAVRLNLDEIHRIVFVPGSDIGTTGYRVDLQVASEITKHLVSSRQLPLRVLVVHGKLAPMIELPEEAEIISTEPGLEEVQAHVEAGDLIIFPAASVRRFLGSGVINLIETTPNVGIVIAAGPYRLNLTSAEVGRETDAIFSFGARGM